MDILITGGAGFIGSRLTDAHIAQEDTVTVLDNLSTGRRENIAHLLNNDRFRFIEGDIRDQSLVEKVVESVDCVYHCAAVVGVRLIMQKPSEALDVSLRGTEVVLHAAQHFNKRLLLTSTSEVYGKNETMPLEEDADRILGSLTKYRWGYAAAKAMDELWAYLAWRQQGVPIVIVRLFNIVGPRQSSAYGMVLPRLVQQALRGEPLTVYGDGTQRRCFLHIADCVAALQALMDEPKATGGIYNIGNPQEVSINDLAQKILSTSGSLSTIHHVSYSEVYGDGFEDMRRRFPCICRIQQLTGWNPTITIDEIIASVIDHQRAVSQLV